MWKFLADLCPEALKNALDNIRGSIVKSPPLVRYPVVLIILGLMFFSPTGLHIVHMVQDPANSWLQERIHLNAPAPPSTAAVEISACEKTLAQEGLRPNEVAVILADFDANGRVDDSFTGQIKDRFRAGLKGSPEIRILECDPLPKLGGDVLASHIAARYPFALLVWGSVDTTTAISHPEVVRYRVHLHAPHLLDQPKLAALFPDEQVVSLPQSDLSTLAFPHSRQYNAHLTFLALLAVGLVEYAERDFRRAVKTLTSADHLNAGSSRELAYLYYFSASAFLMLQDFIHAEADANKALKSQPSAMPFAIKAMAEMFIDADRASLTARKLAAGYPNDLDALRFSAMVLEIAGRRTGYFPTPRGAGDLRRSIMISTSVLRREPRDIARLLGRGNAYLALQENDLAFADASAALQVDAEISEAYLILGRVYYRRGDFVESRSAYAQAKRTNHDPNMRYYAFLHEANTISEHDVRPFKLVDAILLYYRGLALKPDSSDIYNGLCTDYARIAYQMSEPARENAFAAARTNCLVARQLGIAPGYVRYIGAPNAAQVLDAAMPRR